LSRWSNYFSGLLNARGDSEVRQTEIRVHTAEPLVPEPSAFEVEMASEMLKMYKSPDVDQISAELIKAGGNKICSGIHKLINSLWNKEELSIIVPIYKGDKTIKAYHFCQLYTKC
jgi:hypothetical protein